MFRQLHAFNHFTRHLNNQIPWEFLPNTSIISFHSKVPIKISNAHLPLIEISRAIGATCSTIGELITPKQFGEAILLRLEAARVERRKEMKGQRLFEMERRNAKLGADSGKRRKRRKMEREIVGWQYVASGLLGDGWETIYHFIVHHGVPSSSLSAKLKSNAFLTAP